MDLGTKPREETTGQVLLRQLLAAAPTRARTAVADESRVQRDISEQRVGVHGASIRYSSDTTRTVIGRLGRHQMRTGPSLV